MSEQGGLAVSFGAAYLGFATHLGFLRTLIAAGHAPVAVAGASSGALVAGLYAAGVSLEEMEAVFTRADLKRHFIEPAFPLRALRMLLLRPGCPAVLTGSRLSRLLEGLVGGRRLEDCTKARLTVAVANLRTHAVELRTSGPLAETILASCALPGLLAPRRLGAELLWDGGLGSAVPVEQWIEDDTVSRVLAHSVLHDDTRGARAQCERHTFSSAMLAGHQLTADELLRWKLELLRRSGKTVVAIETLSERPRLGLPLSWLAPKPWPDHARDFIALGEAAGARAVAALSGAGTPAASC